MRAYDTAFDQRIGMSRQTPGVALIHHRKNLIAATACLLLFALAAFVQARETISILGSDTMLILNQEWARAYMETHPAIKLEVAGGGSGRGISALLDGKVDIAAASRQMKDKEVEQFKLRTGGRRPWRIVVGLDGIGIYVHNANPIGKLSLDQLAQLFTGQVQNWNEVGGPNRQVHVYTRDRESGTRAFISKHVLGGRDFAPTAHEVSTTAMMTGAVGRNPRAIGYGGIAYSPGAHVIRLIGRNSDEATYPSADNVASGKYPLSRPLQLYVNPASVSPRIERFLRWVLSKKGQEIVKFVGYYPVQPTGTEAPGEPTKPQRLTPDNMHRHGFLIRLTLAAKTQGLTGSGLSGDKVSVKIDFDAEGKAIKDIAWIALNMSDTMVVPLNPSRDPADRHIQGAQFSLRRAFLSDTSVLLGKPGESEEMPSFVIRLADFGNDQ